MARDMDKANRLGGVISLPGFNTPGQMNGFALIGEFETLDGARSFYEGYDQVEDGIQLLTNNKHVPERVISQEMMTEMDEYSEQNRSSAMREFLGGIISVIAIGFMVFLLGKLGWSWMRDA